MESTVLCEAVRKRRRPANFRWREEAEREGKRAFFWWQVAVVEAVIIFGILAAVAVRGYP